MMNSKSQMAEWILDFFRRSNCRANQIVMFPTIMLALDKLNPKEKDLFTSVANELISNDYMTFEQKPIQCIRLTTKGEEYIYSQDAVLDCCVDVRKPTEKIFRDIITLGQSVISLLSYRDIPQKEYYDNLYNFFSSTCQILTLLDDISLRKVVFQYIETVEKTLKAAANFNSLPMLQPTKDIYTFNNAVNTAKTDEERQQLQDFKNLLFQPVNFY